MDFFSGAYDPLADHFSTTRPWVELYPLIEKGLRMLQLTSFGKTLGNPKVGSMDTHNASRKTLGVHFIDDHTPDKPLDEHVFSFEDDVRKLLATHTSHLENIVQQTAQVLHASTVPKVIHTPGAHGAIRPFGTAGIPVAPRAEITAPSNLQSPALRDNRGESRDNLSRSRESPRDHDRNPEGERDRRPSNSPPLRRSARGPHPNRSLIAFLQQTAQEPGIWNEQVEGLIALAIQRVENEEALDDSTSDSDC